MPSHPDVVALRAGGMRLDIDLAAGARAVDWSIDDIAMLARHGDDAVEYGMYPMAPWAGRLRGNEVVAGARSHALPVTYDRWALHGTVLRAPTRLVEHQQSAGSALLRARVDEHPGWPWPARVEVEWRVEPEAVTTVIEVHAPDAPFPAVVGWHPWFRRQLGVGGPLEWSLAATGRLERGADQLPNGRLLPYDPADGPFDDAFTVPDGRAVVRWPGAVEIDIESDGAWFVVFDELPDSVCVEPQSGPPDGLSDGPAGWTAFVVTPSRPLRSSTTWRVRRAGPAGRG